MPANDTSDPEVKALTQRVEEYRWLYDFKRSQFDRESVAHLYKKDEDFTAYDIAPPVGGFLGWSQYSTAWYRVMKKYVEVNFEYLEDPRVFRRGDVGWSSVSCRWYGVTAGGASFSKDIRITLIWVREDGQWVITHEHASAPRLTEVATGETV